MNWLLIGCHRPLFPSALTQNGSPDGLIQSPDESIWNHRLKVSMITNRVASMFWPLVLLNIERLYSCILINLRLVPFEYFQNMDKPFRISKIEFMPRTGSRDTSANLAHGMWLTSISSANTRHPWGEADSDQIRRYLGLWWMLLVDLYLTLCNVWPKKHVSSLTLVWPRPNYSRLHYSEQDWMKLNDATLRKK